MKRFVIIMSALLASALPLSNVFVTKAMAKDVTVKVGADIQAAIDQVSAANVAGRVVLEEGIYDLTETLILKNYVTIVGAGSGKTVLRFSAGDYNGIQNKGEYSVLRDAGVEGLKLMSTAKGVQRYAVAITALGDTRHRNIVLRDVEITDFGMTHLKRCDNVEITNCRFHDNFVDPVDDGSLYFQNLYLRHVNNAVITDTDLSNNPSSSCLHTVGGDNLTFTRVLCNNSAVQDGANIQEGTTNITFKDCEFIGNGRCGIDIWDQTSSGHIEECTVTDNRQQNFKVNGTFTMLRNNVPSQKVLDSLGWKQNILDDATYYIKVLINSKEAYLTNSASSAKAKFSGKNNTAPERQHWQVTHDGEGYKITSVFDGRYLNEKQEFGTNTYDAAWNTFNIYTSTDGSTAIQTAGCAVGELKDALFWSTSGTSLVLDSPAPDAGLARFVFLKVPETDGIDEVAASNTLLPHYTLAGIRIDHPSSPGIYIRNGVKVVKGKLIK